MSTINSWIRERKGVVLIEIALTPQAKSLKIHGIKNDRLKISVQAPPIDGRANTALIELLSEILGVPKRNIEIVRGETGRQKTVAIVGVDSGEVERRVLRIERTCVSNS